METSWKRGAAPARVARDALTIITMIALVASLRVAHAVGQPDVNRDRQYVETIEKTSGGKWVIHKIPLNSGEDAGRFNRRIPTPDRFPVQSRAAGRGGGGAFVFLLIVFFVAIVVQFVIRAQRQTKTRITDSYVRLAKRFRGSCDRGGVFTNPEVHFTHAGCNVLIDIYSTGGRHSVSYTQAHFFGHPLNVRCEVYPAGVWSRLGNLMGMGDIEIGSFEFDDRYVIKGSEPDVLHQLLTPVVQSQIDRLRGFLGNDDIYVLFSDRKLLVKKRTLIGDYAQLVQFAELAIGLYDEVLGAGQEGIEFVEQATPPRPTEIICKVCGAPITSDKVLCRRCKTPHHRDCWEYFGACSTYGCGEKQYIVPKPKRRDKRGKKRT